MKLNELISPGNASIQGVYQIIASDRVPNDKNYCHYVTSQAIKNNTASDNDFILLLGKDKFVAHSVIVNDKGNVISDSYKDKDLKIKDGVFYYNENGRVIPHEVVSSKRVSNFKKDFM